MVVVLARKWFPWLLSMAVASGCCYPVQQRADSLICDMATRALDVAPYQPPEQPILPPAAPDAKDGKTPPKLHERLEMPRELPGGRAAPLQFPPIDPNNRKESEKKRAEAIDRLFPQLGGLGTDVVPQPGPDGQPLGLGDLQRLALTNSPVIRQAAAELEAARGAAIQAGLYPNPVVGYEGDTLNQGNTAGILGGYIEQTIKTGGKLKLAQAAATMDVQNAQLALRRTQAEVATHVRAGYFAVLVAQENVKISRAVARFTDEVFRVQLEQLKGGQVAPYEPMQLRVLALQARGNVVQARNRYTSAWKQLAATLGLPGLPPTLLAGRVDVPIPVYQYDKVLQQVLNVHTDVQMAVNLAQKARYNLRLAQMTPVPDVDVRIMVQKDRTTPPFVTATSVAVGVPVPVWDRNQGGIMQAQGDLLRAVEEGHRVRSELTGKLAEAFEGYDNNRILLAYYRDHIVPDQVRAYHTLLLRYQQEPDKVTYVDIVTSQQILTGVVTTYIHTLGALWEAVVEVSGLLQTNDFFQVGPQGPETECTGPLPDLEHLWPLPCCHPCTPLPDPVLKGADPRWPQAIPPSADEKLPAPRPVPLPGPTPGAEPTPGMLPTASPPAGSTKPAGQ